LIHQSLHGITEIQLTSHTFRRVQLHSNNRFYRFLMNVCSIIQSSSLIDSVSGDYKFRDFVRDEREMARVFENFLFNFIRLEIPSWEVRRENIAWRASSSTDPNLIYLPRMQTDISIRRGLEYRIIDAKYYQRTMSEYLGSEKFHSGNLYQLMSYLSNSIRGEGNRTSGMLIYPQVDKWVYENYRVLDFEIVICTINLDQPWHGVRSDLLKLLN
jgi:5-methylcytosine-specific restriction enzyme subunit McrC